MVDPAYGTSLVIPNEAITLYIVGYTKQSDNFVHRLYRSGRVVKVIDKRRRVDVQQQSPEQESVFAYHQIVGGRNVQPLNGDKS